MCLSDAAGLHQKLTATQNYLVRVVDTGSAFRGTAQRHATYDLSSESFGSEVRRTNMKPASPNRTRRPTARATLATIVNPHFTKHAEYEKQYPSKDE